MKNLKIGFKKFFKKLDNILYPKNIKCLCCGVDLPEKQNIELCQKCLDKIEFIKESECCKICGKPLKSENICQSCASTKRYFKMARSVSVYDDLMAKLILGFKYYNKPYMKDTFAELLSKKFFELNLKINYVIAVPMTKKREKQRGFNQAFLIADKFTKLTNLELLKDVLIKSKETEHQASLGYDARQRNIKKSFKVTDKKSIKNKNILIIDDVLTTGATTSACAEVLMESGAKNVYVLTVATTLLNDKQKTQKEDKKIKKTTKKIAIKDFVKE